MKSAKAMNVEEEPELNPNGKANPSSDQWSLPPGRSNEPTETRLSKMYNVKAALTSGIGDAFKKLIDAGSGMGTSQLSAEGKVDQADAADLDAEATLATNKQQLQQTAVDNLRQLREAMVDFLSKIQAANQQAFAAAVRAGA